MRCYVDNQPCTCSLDDASEGCHKDTIPWCPPVSELLDKRFDAEDFDPFRAGEVSEDTHLFYLNGLRE